MYDWLSTVNDEFLLILNYSKVVWDINTKFSLVVNLKKNLLCTKNEGFRCIIFGFPTKKCLQLQLGIAGLFFKPHLSNFGRIHLLLSCKNARIFVTIPQMVWKLAQFRVLRPYLEMSLNQARKDHCAGVVTDEDTGRLPFLPVFEML